MKLLQSIALAAFMASPVVGIFCAAFSIGRKSASPPAPAPAQAVPVVPKINYLEWRAPMPPMHSTEPLKVQL